MNKSRAALITLLGLVLAYVLFGPIPVSFGKGDFRAYWSAAYLLAEGENFADPALLEAVEIAYTNWSGDYPVVTWNPPWLLTLLLPLALLPFERAVWLWLWSNIILVFSGAALLWGVIGRERTAVPAHKQSALDKYTLLAPVMAIFFLPAMWALWMGQVNTLVFFGLAAFLYFAQQEKPGFSGVALSLTMVKPHIVYVTVPILLLRAWRRREWRSILGFGGTLLGLTAVVFILRPSFAADYLHTVGGGSLLAWETPTLGGFLTFLWGWWWMKLAGVLVLPAAIAVWWRYGERWSLLELTAGTLFLSVLTAPFGWQYDLVVLLVALMMMMAWLAVRAYGRLETITLTLLLVGMNLLAILQRRQSISEVYTFWFPVSLTGLFLWMRMRRVWN